MTVRARLVHAQAGRKLLLSGNWEVADYGVNASAAHVAYATAVLSALTLPGVYQLGVRPTLRQREGYMHIWRYVGCLVGVPEELSPGSEDEGMALARVGRICEPPPEVDSIIIARTIVSSAAMALGVYDNEEKRRRLELGQTRDVRYFLRAAEMVLPTGKLRCGRCGNHGSGEVRRPVEHRREGAAPADDLVGQEFRPDSRRSGRVGAHRVPRRAAVRREGLGRGAAAAQPGQPLPEAGRPWRGPPVSPGLQPGPRWPRP